MLALDRGIQAPGWLPRQQEPLELEYPDLEINDGGVKNSINTKLQVFGLRQLRLRVKLRNPVNDQFPMIFSIDRIGAEHLR